MILSLLKKIAFAFLWLWVISLISFWLSKQVPGDVILDYLSIEDGSYNLHVNPAEQRQAYNLVANKRGLNLPSFYFSFRPALYPDTLFRIVPLEDQQIVKQWIDQCGNGPNAVQLYRHSARALFHACMVSTSSHQNEYCKAIEQLLHTSTLKTANQQVIDLESRLSNDSIVDESFVAMVNQMKHYSSALNETTSRSFASKLPVLHWYGTHNQYHQWLTGLLTLRPSPSLMDGRNAWTKILEALKWTLLLNGLAVLLALLAGIGIGIWSGLHTEKRKERILSIVLFVFFAVPAFWLATLMILFFSSGEWLMWFPSGGLGPYQEAHHGIEKISILTSHLIMPVICLAIGSLAYISRQVKQSVLRERTQPYVLSLRTMGVSEKTIFRRHIIRNSLFPVITLIGKALPQIFSGSLIIEVIFSIPGMGRLLFTSLMARDWPVVFPVLMLASAVTIFSYMLTDVLYKWLDPRVKSIE